MTADPVNTVNDESDPMRGGAPLVLVMEGAPSHSLDVPVNATNCVPLVTIRSRQMG
jgi:hypothetical protein